jgi:hypothetical protein
VGLSVLLALIERRERLVRKNELPDLAWPGMFVEVNNLQVHISALRWLPDNLALLAALEGRIRDAAKLCGYGDAMYAANGVVRQVNEARTALRAAQLARDDIGEAEFERIKAEGAALGEDDIATLAFRSKDA